MGEGDISQRDYDVILELYRKYSIGTSKSGKGPRDILTRTSKTVGGGVIRAEIGNMLEEFKTNVLISLSSQLDTLQMKKKKQNIERALAIFFPKCRMKHPWMEYPLDQIQVCGICSEDHATCNCTSLPGLKVVYQKAEELEKLCFVSQKSPWHPRPQGMVQDQSQYFNSY
jgi:hypothetical protein